MSTKDTPERPAGAPLKPPPPPLALYLVPRLTPAWSLLACKRAQERAFHRHRDGPSLMSVSDSPRPRLPRSGGPTVHGKRAPPKPSPVFAHIFWPFAAERQAIFFRRMEQRASPWTDDPILRTYRFTNAYRASDRVSQYLIRQIIYRDDLPSTPKELFFRILLFKLFNKIETWEHLETQVGPLTAASFDPDLYAKALDQRRASGASLYSAAYIMPSTGALGCAVKHRGHLQLIRLLLQDAHVETMAQSTSLNDLFTCLRSLPTLGDFLAFQFAIDLNYSDCFRFSEMDFVVAGPGAKDGLAKCFDSFGDLSEPDVIRWVAETQSTYRSQLSEDFRDLFGRPLQLIDIQNLFCEISKYTRVSHPHVSGLNGRTQIKQKYRARSEALRLFYPPHWGMNDRIPSNVRAAPCTPPQRITGNPHGLRYLSAACG